MNGKKRYEITRGQKNFRVERINPIQYRNEIFRISKAAFSVYPARYRPSVTKEQINREINGWHDDIVFGAFSRENLLQGYCHILDYATYASYSSHKANPDCEKLGINAALVAGMLDYYNDRLGERFYICDGERNILHKTAFQNYLEKYFDFRKAYSKLHVAYRPFVGIGVRTLFPFRKLLVRADRVSVVHNINGVLRIEEICRETR